MFRRSTRSIEDGYKNRKYPDRELIHHSDRGRLQGIQYCSKAYIKLLKKHKAKVSMTQSGNPYDNALAERMNNTIKNEFLEGRGIMGLASGKRQLSQIIWVYSDCRLHWSAPAPGLDFKTPEQVHQYDLKVKKRSKKVDWELRKKRKKEIDLEKIQYYRY
ncbi:integrase core domain-containing protein [Chondrinema litorale]|uniref:integrase core domain-containing protein n=1 Tax=Chondrinema litorale TaxID=2994555 RepID=UPI0025434400|nr:integrase core domain-containing protein [Chondrinema litorale]UZR99087.1 integrase core domain-containing protein [Chondrinema litorale]